MAKINQAAIDRAKFAKASEDLKSGKITQKQYDAIATEMEKKYPRPNDTNYNAILQEKRGPIRPENSNPAKKDNSTATTSSKKNDAASEVKPRTTVVPSVVEPLQTKAEENKDNKPTKPSQNKYYQQILNQGKEDWEKKNKPSNALQAKKGPIKPDSEIVLERNKFGTPTKTAPATHVGYEMKEQNSIDTIRNRSKARREAQKNGASKEKLDSFDRSINADVDRYKKSFPESYEKNKDYIDELVKMGDSNYAKKVERAQNVVKAVAAYQRRRNEGAKEHSLELSERAVWDALNVNKGTTWGVYRDYAPAVYLMFAEEMSPEEILAKKNSWLNEYYNTIAPSEGAQKAAPNDKKMLAQLDEAKTRRDEFAYEIDRAYEKALYSQKYGKDWRNATIENADGSLVNIPDKEALKKILSIDVQKYEQTNDMLRPQLTTNDIPVVYTLKESDKIRSGIYDNKPLITQTEDGKYIILGYKGVTYTAKEIAQMGMMYEKGGADEIGKYIDEFVRPRRNQESAKSTFDFFDNIAKNGNALEKAGATAGAFVYGKLLTPFAAGEALGATIDSAISGISANKDYGMFASAKSGTDAGRQSVGSSIFTDVVGTFTEDEKKAAEHGAKIFASLDGTANTVSNVLMGAGGVLMSASEALYGSLDEGIQEGRDAKKALVKGGFDTAIEFATEAIQLKGLEDILALGKLEKNVAKRYIRNTVLGSLNELPGELASSYSTAVFDNLIYGEDSTYNREINRMIANGEASSRMDAKLEHFWNTTGETVAAVLLSQVFLGGVSLIADPKNKTAKTYAEYGKRFREGAIDVNTLIEQASTSKNGVTRKIANSAGTNGENLTDEALGLLYFSAKNDFVGGKLSTVDFAEGKLFEAKAKEIKEAGKLGDFLEFASNINDEIISQTASTVKEDYQQNGDVSDSVLGTLYSMIAEDLYINAQEYVENKDSGETDTVTDDSIGDALKNATEEAGEAVKLANENPVEKDVITVKTSDGNTVSVKGEYLAKLGGDKIYTVKGSDIGLDNGFYAVDSRTGDTIASGETKSVLYNAVKEIKKNYTDVAITNDASVAEDVNEVVGESVEVVPAEIAKSTVTESGADKTLAERNAELAFESKKKVNNEAFVKEFASKKTEAVDKGALSGDAVSVGKTVLSSDLENTVIALAKESGNVSVRKAAQKYDNTVFKNPEQRIRAIGELAQQVGITGEDAIQSLAASLGQRYVYSAENTSYQNFSKGMRAEFEKSGNNLGLQALDYLDSLYKKSGISGVEIAINSVGATGYTEDNRNRAVENFATSMKYSLKASGINADIKVIYDSSKDSPRGVWERKNGKTTITINGAKLRGAESASWVLTHELFHEGAKNDPEFVKRVLDIFREIGLYDEKSFNSYAETYFDSFNNEGYKDKLAKGEITQEEYDEAFYDYVNEEIAADLMSHVMGNEELANMFASKATTEDLNFIVKFFKKLLDGIKKVFEGSNKASEFVYEAESLIGMFERAVKYNDGKKASAKAEVKNSLSSIGYAFFNNENLTAKEAEKMLKDGSWKKSEGYKKYFNDCISVYEQAYGKASKKDIAQIEKSIEGIMRVAIAAKKAGYDIQDNGAKRNTRDSKNRLLFTSLEPNSDYITSSDISAICDKRKTFTEIYDDIVRIEEANNVPPSERFFSDVNNYFLLHKIMASKGLVVPCEECYVESMRKNLAPMANAFITLVTETDAENKKNAQLYNQSGKNKGKLKENNAKIREKVIEICAKNGGSKEQIDKIRNLSADELAKFIDDVGSAENLGVSLDEITVEMLTTAEGLAQLKLRSPLLYEAFNSFYGQSKPKMPKEATPFRPGELIALFTDKNNKINTTLIEKVKSTGGFRLQSYSDFQIGNFVDVLQTIFEASMLGLNGHAYTKVPAFLDATEGTNLKRNLSIFMYEDGGKWMLDKKNSFPMELDDIYALVAKDKSGNTSIIAVSQNAKMSAWIMANDLVGYGIPFHKSGLKMDIVRLRDVKTPDGRTIKGYSNQIDHTKQQSEVYKYDKDGKKKNSKVSKPIDIYSFWDFENKEGLSKNELIEKNLKAYIDECEKAGYRPKFRDYVMNNDKVLNDVLAYSKELGFVSEDATIDDISFKHGEYTIPYGYYKFLGDFGMFTPEGEASPIKPLSLATYDFDKAVKYFNNAEELREKELLQQFENGKVREEYRQLLKEGKMTLEQLQEVLNAKKNEAVQEVVTGAYKDKKYALPGKNKLDTERLELAKEPEKNEAVKSASSTEKDNSNSVFNQTQRNKVIKALNGLANNFDVPRTERADFVADVMNALEDVLQSGVVNDSVYEDVAKTIYKYAREESGEADYANKVKDIKKRVFGIGKIYVSEAVKGDITDYNVFRKAFGKLLSSTEEAKNDSTVPEVDQLYADLRMDYPDVFTEDLVGGDQLKKIAEVLEQAREYEVKGTSKRLDDVYDFGKVKNEFAEVAGDLIDSIAESTGIELVEDRAVYESLREADNDISATEYSDEFYITKGATNEEIEGILDNIEKNYPRSSAEYKFVKKLLSAEKAVKDAKKTVRGAEALIKAKGFEADGKRVVDFTKGIAKEYGFDKDTSKVADVDKKLNSFYNSLSEYLQSGEETDLTSVVKNIGSVTETVAKYASSEVDTLKLGGYLLNNFMSLDKGKTGEVKVKSAEDISNSKSGVTDMIAKVMSIAKKSEAELKSDLESAKDGVYKATAKLRAQQTQPFFEKVIDAFAEEKEASNKRIQEMRQHNKEVREKQKAKRDTRKKQERLLSAIRRLRKMKTDASTREVINDIIGDLDYVSISLTDKNRIGLENLRERYLERSKNEDFIKEPGTEDRLARLDMKQISELTPEELSSILETALRLEKDIAFDKSVTIHEKAVSKYKAAKEGISAVLDTKGAKYEGKRSGAIKYFTSLLTKRSFFKKMFNYDTKNKMFLLTEEVNNGQKKALKLHQDFQKPFKELILDKNIKTFTGKKATEYSTGITSKSGKEIKITPAQKVSLYLQSKNHDFLRHAAGGGIKFPDIKLLKDGKVKEAYAKGQTVVLTPSEIKKIVSGLTEYEKAWADATEKFFNTDSRKYINETSLELYGYELANVENYFPIMTNKNFNSAEPESLIRDGTLEGKGFLKDRIHASNQILLEDVASVLERHMKDVADFAGLAAPLKNFTKAYTATVNYSDGTQMSVKEAIGEKWGPAAQKYIDNFISDMQAPRKRDKSFIDSLRSKRAAAVMIMNVPVTLGNFGNLSKASTELGSKAVIKGFFKGKVDTELVQKYTPYLQMRMEGYTTKEFGDVARGDSFGVKKGLVPKIINMMQFVDILCTKATWNASEYFVKQNNKDLKVGSDEYYKAVAAVFDKTIENTQVNDLTYQKSDILMSTNFFVNEATMFKSELLKNLDIMRDAAGEYNAIVKKNGGIKKTLAEARKGNNEVKEVLTHTRRVVTSQAACMLWVATIDALVKGLWFKKWAYKDEEEDEVTRESILEEAVQSLVSGVYSMFPGAEDAVVLVGNIVSGVAELLDVEVPIDFDWYGMNANVYEVINDLYDGSKKIIDTIGKYQKGDVSEKSIKMAVVDFASEDIAKALGVPTENLRNVVSSTILNAYEKAGGEYYGKYLRYKIEEDGTAYYTRQKMISQALKAKNAGDMEAYNLIREDMIKNKYASPKTFDETINEFETAIELGTYGEVFEKAVEYNTKARNTYDRDGSGDAAFRYEVANHDRYFAENAVELVKDLPKEQQNEKLAIAAGLIRNADHKKTRGQQLAINNFNSAGDEGIFKFSAEGNEMSKTIEGEKQKADFSFDDYIDYVDEYRDATEFLRLSIFGTDEDVANYGKEISERYAGEAWMMYAKDAPLDDATDKEKADYYKKVISETQYAILDKYKTKYFEDYGENYEAYGDIAAGKNVAGDLYTWSKTGENAYAREIYFKADDFIKKSEELIEGLPEGKRAEAMKLVTDYANKFSATRRKGGELAAKYYDKVYGNVAKPDTKITTVFDGYSEYSDISTTIDGKKYTKDLSVKDYIKFNGTVADADELARLVCFGDGKNVSSEISKIKNAYSGQPWLEIVEAASKNLPKDGKERIEFYVNLRNNVVNSVKLSYQYDYIKESSSGSKVIDDFLVESNAVYKASTYYKDADGESKSGEYNAKRIFYDIQSSYVKNSLKLIKENPKLTDKQRADYMDALAKHVEKIKYNPSEGQKLVAKVYDDYKLNEEDYNEKIKAAIARTGDKTLDKLSYDTAEGVTMSKTKDNIPYQITLNQPDYMRMVASMDKGQEYAALYIFKGSKAANEFAKNLSKDEKAWIQSGVSEFNKEVKKINKLVSQGIIPKQSAPAYYYYALTGKIKTQVRNDCKDTYFSEFKKEANSPKGYYVKYNP